MSEEFEVEIERVSVLHHLISDNDGHWFVIKDGQEDDFYKWVEDMEEYRDSEFDFEGNRLRYGSPSSVYFQYWFEK